MLNLLKQFSELFCKKAVLKNFANFTGKHLCESLFVNKVVGLRPATLLKKRLWHRRFPVNFAKFLQKPFLQKTSGVCFLFDKLTFTRKVVSFTPHIFIKHPNRNLTVHSQQQKSKSRCRICSKLTKKGIMVTSLRSSFWCLQR